MNRYKNNVIKKQKLCIEEKFEDMSEDFREKYEQKHLSNKEFDAIKSKIITPTHHNNSRGLA